MKLWLVLSAVILLLSASGSVLAQAPPSAASSFSNSSVSIPWADFKQIIEKLTAPPVTDEPPPYEALLSDADYNAVVGEKVSVVVKANVVVLKPRGWAKVPVMGAGVPIMDATLDGKPTALVGGDDGMLHLVLKDAGPHVLVLRMALATSADSGPEQFTLPALRAQVNRIEVRVGKPDQLVTLSSGYAESRTAGAATVAQGSFPPADSVRISWARKAPKAEKEEARVSAQVGTLLTVGEGLGVYTSIIEYDIRHKPMSSFRLTLPADVSVADVSTEGLVDWRVDKKDGAQELSVAISFEALGKHQLAVTFEKTLPAGEEATFKSADLIVEDVVHETGFLGVAVRTNVQVTAENPLNLAPVDASELPPDLRGNSDQTVLFGFKYIKHPSVLDLKVVKHADASVLACAVERADYRVMVTGQGKELIEATYRIANRSRQFLTLTLPEGTDLWSVFRDGEPVKAAEDHGKVLLPIFKGGLEETFTLKVLAYRKTGSLGCFGRGKIELPMLDAGTNEMRLELYLPYRFRFGGFGGKLQPAVFSHLPAGGPGKANGDTSETGGNKSAESGEGWFATLEKTKFDKNVVYRKAQTKTERTVVNLPVQAANAAYTGAMARGALPVAVDVTWDGQPFAFAARIVDPGEATGLSFYYGRRIDSAWFVLLAFACAAYLGWIAGAFILAGRTNHVGRPPASGLWLALPAAVILVIASVVTGGGTGTTAFGILLGALAVLVGYFVNRRKADPKPKPGPTTEAPETQSGETNETRNEKQSADKGGE